MQATLILESGKVIPKILTLTPSQPATLGRSRESSMVVHSDLVSRVHAKIYYEDGRWVLRDFGLNGTRVEGSRVTNTVDLDDGSVIQIGDAQLRFQTKLQTIDATRSKLTVQPAWSQIDPPNVVNRNKTPAPMRAMGETVGTKIESEIYREGIPNDSPATETQRKVDELEALCRYMTAAVDREDQHDLIGYTLRTILNQTSATIVGYLGLDANDLLPKMIVPEQGTVDMRLSRKLTRLVVDTKKMAWLFGDNIHASPIESLQSFSDAACFPLSTHEGTLFAAIHIYRSGRSFTQRDIDFFQAITGYLAPMLENFRAKRKLVAENNRLRVVTPVADELLGDSNAIMHLRQQISKAAQQPFTVLINGESGSGKELVAQALHRHSPRCDGPLQVVNCAAIAPTLLEAELFGYRKGAFSGANRDHPGLFEQADEGTLFLDEVGELSPECQAKLLRAIEGKAFRPVGATSDVKVDVRVVAATHRDLETEVREGRFRQDLYFRLKVITLRVSPLREHSEDIPELAHFFLERLSTQCRRTFKLTSAAMDTLQAFPWPGNVRQLRAVLESTAVMSEEDIIDADKLPIGKPTEPVAVSSPTDMPESLDIDVIETWAIRKALLQTGGNISQAARLLGMSRDTLHTKLKKKGISRDDVLQEAAEAAE